MFRILNTLDLSYCPEALAAFDGIGTVDTLPWSYEAVLHAIGEYDAYLASTSVRVDAAMIARAARLKVIGSPSTGTDHLDLEAITRAGIIRFDLSRERDLLDGFTATAELAFALLLALHRRLFEALDAVHQGNWARERFTGVQLFGKTLGILGLGRLGTMSARIGRGFGMRVIAHDISLEAQAEGVRRVAFDALFREADAILVHVHLREDTRRLVDGRAFSLMKPTAVIINTSRGAVLDEAALLEALAAGRIAGAGLDVIDGEWLEDIGQHPLVRYAQDHPNLLITPHVGGATIESIRGARAFMARRIAEYLRGLDQ